MELMNPQHVVLVVGSAVSGSEAAFQLARRGIRCVVIEQNERPYGKIEDGLPRWHASLRRQEMHKIDEKLGRPEIDFVPATRLGRDISLAELRAWGPSAVVLAVGAWRDRRMPVPGIDQFEGRGFYYQNPFVYWFNHYPEPDYRGPQVEPMDGALVVGGGLASLDVVKIVMLETVTRALSQRGLEVDLYDMERRGISTVLAERGLTLAELGLRGATLVYRRRLEDMPVVELPDGATPQQLERAWATRRKLMHKCSDKYLFRFQDRRVPVAYLTEGEHLAGIRLVATEVHDGRAISLEGTEQDVLSRLVVSAIGSIPEPIEGIPMRGETYRVKDIHTGELEGLEGIYAAGNAVTGRGNITVSLHHGRVVAEHMLEHYLMGSASGHEAALAVEATEAGTRAAAMAERLTGRAPLTGEQVARILERVGNLQRRVDYPGDYRAYAARLSRH
jgi:NADPH-dependent glutamate synthase beta subunit-like oxidoreductase